MLCALAALCLDGSAATWQVGFVASFASKLADTVSSEVGKVRHCNKFNAWAFMID